MLVDSHCHLDFLDFTGERDDIIARAGLAGVGLMVTISTRINKIEQIRAISGAYKSVFHSVGTHPHNAQEEQGIESGTIIELSQHPKCVAIGEAGLDYFYDKAPREAQVAGLYEHITAARQTGLPLVIHARDADADMEKILVEESGKGGFPFLLHCFSSGQRLADAAVELGGYVSFSGILTFKRSEELRGIAKTVPYDRLLVETDAPYLAPQAHRGKRNEPAYVMETAKVLAQTVGVTDKEIAHITTENFFRLFAKVPRSFMPGIS
jgi:TatD DNase family protein